MPVIAALVVVIVFAVMADAKGSQRLPAGTGHIRRASGGKRKSAGKRKGGRR